MKSSVKACDSSVTFKTVNNSATFKSISIKFNYSKISLYTFQLEPAEKSATLIRYPEDRSAILLTDLVFFVDLS